MAKVRQHERDKRLVPRVDPNRSMVQHVERVGERPRRATGAAMGGRAWSRPFRENLTRT